MNTAESRCDCPTGYTGECCGQGILIMLAYICLFLTKNTKFLYPNSINEYCIIYFCMASKILGDRDDWKCLSN